MTPNSRLRGGLHLPISTVLALTITVAIAVAGGVFFAGWELLGARSLKPERQLTASTLFDLVKLAAGVVAGVGALVALVVAYRRQLVDEAGALREEKAALRDITRLHTERFTTAVSQLGDESAAVRLGGVHALAGLADDAPTPELRQTCIDVLCAYVRLPYTAETDLPPNNTEARHAYLSLREVRHTVIRLIREHLLLADDRPHSWQGHNFDFTNAVFDGGDFSDVQFSGGRLSFRSARFEGGTVNFNDAEFGDGRVDFGGAVFSGGTVNFRGARFDGGRVNFHRAAFEGGTVDFRGAELNGSDMSFFGAAFSDGTVTFGGAELSDGQFSFRRAEFEGGTVDFSDADFSGARADFRHAVFSGGTVDLLRARGAAPDGLVPLNVDPLPTGLRLPPTWRRTS